MRNDCSSPSTGAETGGSSTDNRIARVRYVLPRHWVTIWAANWVGPGRGRKSTRPGANGVIELSPFEFLDRLADLVPPPRKPGWANGFHSSARDVVATFGSSRYTKAGSDPCDGRRQEAAHFEPKVRERAKARTALPA